MKKRRPFRIVHGVWYLLCMKCLVAVREYRKGGWAVVAHRERCDRCRWRVGRVEFFPVFKGDL